LNASLITFHHAQRIRDHGRDLAGDERELDGNLTFAGNYFWAGTASSMSAIGLL